MEIIAFRLETGTKRSEEENKRACAILVFPSFNSDDDDVKTMENHTRRSVTVSSSSRLE